jgi:RNA polymerase subunit RPABC4/transcription elongation factor Spt4
MSLSVATKPCKFCFQSIDARAHACPYCGKGQSAGLLWLAILIVFGPLAFCVGTLILAQILGY